MGPASPQQNHILIIYIMLYIFYLHLFENVFKLHLVVGVG